MFVFVFVCGPMAREAETAPIALGLMLGFDDEIVDPAGLGCGGAAVIAGDARLEIGCIGL